MLRLIAQTGNWIIVELPLTLIHARPHLTARVFRYLWTLIGKAAIDRGILQSQAYSTKQIR